MGKSHTDYQPTEYEQMLIAAKWIAIEDVDSEYQEYARGNCDSVSYGTWLSMRHEWDELNAQYEREIQPYYQWNEGSMEQSKRELENSLLRDMSFLEVMLGY